MEWKDVLVIIVSCVLGSSGVMGIIFWALTKHINKLESKKECEKNRLTSIENGTKALLHDRLYQATSFYLKRGYCSQNDKENLDCMARPYIDMGMNGTCKAQVKECLSLPNDKPAKSKVKNNETAEVSV